MPYKTNAALPKGVKNHLPSSAQTTYRKAFNHAVDQYKKPSKRRGGASISQDEVAAKVAWSAVKKGYRKSGDTWVKKATKTRIKKSTASKTVKAKSKN